MKISIVTAYYNRKPQFLATLRSLEATAYENFEVVIIDDGSEEEHVLSAEDLEPFSFDIRHRRIRPESKNYCNPCVPFNVGFGIATGDAIIIQNPECFHMGDVLSHVAENLKQNKYFSFGCFSADPDKSIGIQEQAKSPKLTPLNGRVNLYVFSGGYGTKSASHDGQFNTWYNHSIHRPMGYHFCSAITATDLRDLGGFDPLYATGLGYDDDEFLFRIKQKGMEVEFVDDPFVIHQYHPGFCGHQPFKPNQNNFTLFHNVTKKRPTWKVN